MRKTTIYLPASLEQALAVLRRQSRLTSLAADRYGHVICYGNRAEAVRHAREAGAVPPGAEVPLLVMDVDEGLMRELLSGDFVHVGPTARWREPSVLELEHYAQERVWDEARCSLQIEPAGR